MLHIARLETFHDEFCCFVKVTAESGDFGWGQCAPWNADITAQVFHRQIAPWALGAPTLDRAALIARIEAREHRFAGSYRARALAGLDTALWDLQGRVEGKPVVELLGGKPGRIRACATSLRSDITPEGEADRLARLCGERGFTAAKWRIEGGPEPAWQGRTEAVIPAVAHALGPDIEKRVDAGGGLSVARAIAVGRRLEAEGIAQLAEPVACDEPEHALAVTQALSLDVAGGGRHCDAGAWARMIRLQAVDVACPDPLGLGGLTRTLEVARLTAHAGMPLAPQVEDLSLGLICGLHLLGAIPNAGACLDLPIEGDDYRPWQHGLFLGDPFRVEAGHLRIPDAPGWGVEVDPGWLARATHRETSAEGLVPQRRAAR